MGLLSCAQSPCKCPEYKDGIDAFRQLIEQSVINGHQDDSFQLMLTFDSLEGYTQTLKVDTNSYKFLNTFSIEENGKDNWDFSKVYLDNGNKQKILFLNYKYPSSSAQCSKLEWDLVCMEFDTKHELNSTLERTLNTNIYEIFDLTESAKFNNDYGIEKLKQFIDSNLNWPSTMGEVCGNWIYNVSFIVETDGRISNIKSKGTQSNFGLNEEAIRVVKLTSGLWTPAKIRDVNVRMRMRIPVTFEH